MQAVLGLRLEFHTLKNAMGLPSNTRGSVDAKSNLYARHLRWKAPGINASQLSGQNPATIKTPKGLPTTFLRAL